MCENIFTRLRFLMMNGIGRRRRDVGFEEFIGMGKCVWNLERNIYGEVEVR